MTTQLGVDSKQREKLTSQGEKESQCSKLWKDIFLDLLVIRASAGVDVLQLIVYYTSIHPYIYIYIYIYIYTYVDFTYKNILESVNFADYFLLQYSSINHFSTGGGILLYNVQNYNHSHTASTTGYV